MSISLRILDIIPKYLETHLASLSWSWSLAKINYWEKKTRDEKIKLLKEKFRDKENGQTPIRA